MQLLAVSKKHGAQSIKEAFKCGQRHFGENYVQEALEKISTLQSLDIVWHFIGPIQSNKTKLIAENFSWVHSVDRLKIAQRLSDQRPRGFPPLHICVQINIDAEESKSGIKADEIQSFAQSLAKLPNITLRGLMTIPLAGNSEAAFTQMKALFTDLQQSGDYPNLDTLSMGMSADLEIAIANGATIVRVGTDIFGTRNH